MFPRRIGSSLLVVGLVVLVPLLAGCPRDDDDDDSGPAPQRPVSTSIDIGCRPIGDMRMEVLTVTNNGEVDIEIDEVRIAGHDPARVDITIDPNSMIMLPAMSSMDLDVSIHCLGETHVGGVVSYIEDGLISAAAGIFGRCTDYTSPVTFNGMATACTGGGMDSPVEFTLVCDPGSLEVLADVQTFPPHCNCDTESISGPLDPNGDFDIGFTVPGKTCDLAGSLTAPGMYDIATSASENLCMIECTGMASP